MIEVSRGLRNLEGMPDQSFKGNAPSSAECKFPAGISSFLRSDLAAIVALLASSGTYVGTSSWKYEGWLGLIYTPEGYMTRGKFSRAKFETTKFANA